MNRLGTMDRKRGWEFGDTREDVLDTETGYERWAQWWCISRTLKEVVVDVCFTPTL